MSNNIISLLIQTLEENFDGTYYFKTKGVVPSGTPSIGAPTSSDLNSKLLLSIGDYSNEKRIRIS